jgi:hypothetical protein
MSFRRGHEMSIQSGYCPFRIGTLRFEWDISIPEGEPSFMQPSIPATLGPPAGLELTVQPPASEA